MARQLYGPTKLSSDEGLPAQLRGCREVWIAGETIHGLYWPASTGRPTILFFHGNSDHVYHWGAWYQCLGAPMIGCLMVDYPGFGKSSGQPSERSLFACADAAVGWMTRVKGVPIERLVPYGVSLGGAVAAYVAERHEVMALVLESTFTSLPDVVWERGFRLLDRLLYRHRYRTEQRLRRVRCPALVIHGGRDTSVRPHHAWRNAAALRGSAVVHIVHEAGHRDLADVAGPEYGERIRSWLDSVDAASST